MNPPSSTDTPEDLTASDVAWDLDTLLADRSVEEWLDRAGELADGITDHRGHLGDLDSVGLAKLMGQMAEVQEAIGRAGYWASLRYATDTTDEARGALVQRVEERATEVANRLVFVELEWAALPEEHAESLLADDSLGFCAHHLRSARRYRPYLRSEPEEQLLADKRVTGASAWSRLFGDLTAAITVDLDSDGGTGPDGPGSSDQDGAGTDGGGGHRVGLEQALAELALPDRSGRAAAAEAITGALVPTLRTRAYVFNVLMADKASEDRLRGYGSWLSARNLANEASDTSVAALVDAVTSRYETARRWYRLKAGLLGIDRLADYDRLAPVGGTDTRLGWSDARSLVLEAYQDFSPALGEAAGRFFSEGWIDAPVRAGKRPGAFCAYTVPSHHPYLLLNWTGRPSDALTLAHELGHGLHAWLARSQGIFHQATPLTLAETASVFGETLTFHRLLDSTTDATARLDLAARAVEGAIATVFRQIAMHCFEEAVHTARRTTGELSVQELGDLWHRTQHDLLGDAVELTEGYRTWWSYIPHFMATPGYVYAYAYGQLLALSVYRRYQEQGPAFVDHYLEMLSAGGSRPPAELGRMVGCDLEDPDFWHAGLDLVDEQVDAAEAAASKAGHHLRS